MSNVFSIPQQLVTSTHWLSQRYTATSNHNTEAQSLTGSHLLYERIEASFSFFTPHQNHSDLHDEFMDQQWAHLPDFMRSPSASELPPPPEDMPQSDEYESQSINKHGTTQKAKSVANYNAYHFVPAMLPEYMRSPSASCLPPLPAMGWGPEPNWFEHWPEPPIEIAPSSWISYWNDEATATPVAVHAFDADFVKSPRPQRTTQVCIDQVLQLEQAAAACAAQEVRAPTEREAHIQEITRAWIAEHAQEAAKRAQWPYRRLQATRDGVRAGERTIEHALPASARVVGAERQRERGWRPEPIGRRAWV